MYVGIWYVYNISKTYANKRTIKTFSRFSFLVFVAYFFFFNRVADGKNKKGIL